MVVMNMPRNLDNAWQDVTAEIGVDAKQPTPEERRKLSSCLNRMFSITYKSRTINPILQKYWMESIIALGVAKNELSGGFEGQFVSKSTGGFVVTPIYPGYFGYNKWQDDVTGTEGAIANWIDNQTPPNASGATLGPAQIGSPVGCHLMVGIKGYSSNPSVGRVHVEKGGDQFSEIDLTPYDDELQLKGLKTPFILVGGKKNDQILMSTFLESGTTDSIAPHGLSFITGAGSRITTPQAMAGATTSSIFKY